jgi:hypothetical protein
MMSFRAIDKRGHIVDMGHIRKGTGSSPNGLIELHVDQPLDAQSTTSTTTPTATPNPNRMRPPSRTKSPPPHSASRPSPPPPRRPRPLPPRRRPRVRPRSTERWRQPPLPHWLRSWGGAWIDFLYPPTCPLCFRRIEHGERILCSHCQAQIRLSDGWRCPRCGAAGHGAAPEAGRRCRLCPPEGAAWSGALAAAGYFDRSARCVHCSNMKGVGNWAKRWHR